MMKHLENEEINFITGKENLSKRIAILHICWQNILRARLHILSSCFLLSFKTSRSKTFKAIEVYELHGESSTLNIYCPCFGVWTWKQIWWLFFAFTLHSVRWNFLRTLQNETERSFVSIGQCVKHAVTLLMRVELDNEVNMSSRQISHIRCITFMRQSCCRPGFAAWDRAISADSIVIFIGNYFAW